MIDTKPVAPEKASLPMVVTPVGMMTTPEQPTPSETTRLVIVKFGQLADRKPVLQP